MRFPRWKPDWKAKREERRLYLEIIGDQAKLADFMATYRNGEPWSLDESIALTQLWKTPGGKLAAKKLFQRSLAACQSRASVLGISRNWKDHPDPLPESEQTDLIYAFRTWRVITNGRDAILRSVWTGEPWPAGVPMQAHGIEQHDDAQDHSGIHAFKYPVSPKDYPYALPVSMEHEIMVAGKVALWGRVIEHEEGYRAEFAYPVTVICDTEHRELGQAIGRSYGIEIVPPAPSASPERRDREA